MGSVNEYADKVLHSPGLNYTPDPRGLAYVFFQHMKAHKQKIAQIDGLTGEKDTYENFLGRCVRASIVMKSKGIQPGDTVTLCTLNHLNSCVPYLATMFVGAVSSSLDPSLSQDDVTHLLKQVPPKMIFTVPESLGMIEKALDEISVSVEIVVFGPTAKYTSFDVFLQPHSEEASFKPYEAKSLSELVLIFFSSGTSGLPKGICVSHYTCLCQAHVLSSVGYTFDIALAFASSYWGTSALFWSACIVTGNARLVYPKFDSKWFWHAVSTYKPTITFVAPSQAVMAYNQGRPTNVKNTLRDILIGGGPLLEQQVRNIRHILPESRVCLCYGQTEIGIFSIFQPANPDDLKLLAERPLSSGRVIPGITYKVVDLETDESLGPHQRGELCYKAGFSFSGYYNQDSSHVRDAHGWIRSGDIVYYDEDHCLYIVDRIKEMLKFQSFHVPPGVIENILLAHPAINRAVVIGIPHELDGDHPMAVVELKDSQNADPREIVKFVDERVIDRQRLRAGVRIVDQLPITPSGKVKRKEVRKMILENGV